MNKIKIKKANKKGVLLDLFIWMVVGFVTILFFAIWIYGFNLVTVNITGIESVVGVNETVGSIGTQTFGKINSAQTSGLHLLGFVILFMSALSILVSYFVVKSHPVFFVVYLFVIIGAIITSVYISNQYEDLMINATIGATLSGFTASSYVMLYLPVWTAVIGLIGTIILFSGMIRDANAGGSIV